MLKPHQEFESREMAALALEAQGYVRDGGKWPRERWTKDGSSDWLLVTWPTGLITIEWPEQAE